MTLVVGWGMVVVDCFFKVNYGTYLKRLIDVHDVILSARTHHFDFGVFRLHELGANLAYIRKHKNIIVKRVYLRRVACSRWVVVMVA